MNDAKRLIHEQAGIPDDAIGKGEVDRILADLKLRLIKKLDEDELAAVASSESGEAVTAAGEELAADVVSLALPEERHRIAALLAIAPAQQETKIEKLLRGLGALWKQTPGEKIVIFATCLATVNLLSREIENAYPGQGVVVLRGGDHGAKLAAERRFKSKDGPRVLVYTAAGREGINLQFARILFNFDLPWNPMDLEQRIGRIHRYGQKDTAQVYNLVLGDTLEGRIFLLLNDKLKEIATALGKVDESGNVTEDLRTQILGQLSDRLSYDELYRNALSDPELKRTRQELEAALSNANEARKVVFELFQDLERFSLDDYRPLSDVDASKSRIVDFLRIAVPIAGGAFEDAGTDCYHLRMPGDLAPRHCTLDRDLAQEDERIELLGIDHAVVNQLFQALCEIPPSRIGAAVQVGLERPSVLTVWQVQVYGKGGESGTHIVAIAVDVSGKRIPSLERRYGESFRARPSSPRISPEACSMLLHDVIEPTLMREVHHRGLSSPESGYSTKLIAWLEVM
ncbi:MAG: RNA polymerase-associated protein RapA [Lentisphaerae bacterium ADurb.Bin082]|nr:MAG: RNA polymerase-associated protein RapA [Lentisphaerae bacterium ADurb.Bin082]